MSLHNSTFEKIINGEKNFFDLIFKEYYTGLCIFAKDYLRSIDVAQEITQEVFINLWENQRNIHIKTSLKSYLYRSVHNRCLNYIRDNISASNREIHIDQLKNRADLLLMETPEDVFDESFSERMEMELERAIENLPDQCKIIFKLNRYENLSYPQIAKQLNISLSTVKTQMSRAMNKLKESLIKYL